MSATNDAIIVLAEPDRYAAKSFVASLHVSWRWMLTLLLLNAAFIVLAYACYVIRYQLVHQQFPGRKRKAITRPRVDAAAMLLPVSSPRQRRRHQQPAAPALRTD